MLMLYAGYPCALEGLRVLNETWSGRARRFARGQACRGGPRGAVRCAAACTGACTRGSCRRSRRCTPTSRTGWRSTVRPRALAAGALRRGPRRLVTVAALAALGWERQLVSHLRGARRLGAAPATVERALRAGLSAGAPAHGGPGSARGPRPRRRGPHRPRRACAGGRSRVEWRRDSTHARSSTGRAMVSKTIGWGVRVPPGVPVSPTSGADAVCNLARGRSIEDPSRPPPRALPRIPPPMTPTGCPPRRPPRPGAEHAH